jgi:glycosyltransferase involved in cell wall biosynthesis
MDNPLISVIVPIYMIDRYVGLCIESIINQTYKNLEIILVDDGGKDRCPEICDLYKQKDQRIKVVHKPNGGLVSARKAGLQESNGIYITYVDGDDWIGPGFIEALYTAAVTSNADMVCAGFTRDLFTKSAHFLNYLPSGIYEGEKLKNLWKSMISFGSYYRPGITTYVWNKLFKREVLLDAQMGVDNRISIGEDGAVTYPALLSCSRVAVTDNVAYHYRQREDSMLKQSAGYSAEAQKLLYLYNYLMRWAEGTDPELKIREQVQDYVLSIALMRSGGRLPQDDYSTFDSAYYGKDVVVYSAGTFGQQLVNRFRESGHCNVVAWLDDDYWEYRRCCLNVDPVENITALTYDFILIATVDGTVAEKIKKRLMDLGVSVDKMLTVSVPDNKEQLIKRFLDVDALLKAEAQRKREVTSHA